MDNKYNIDKTIILNIINKYIKVKDNQYNIDLVKLGMDSILFVTIIIEIEEKYNIEIPPSILLLSKMNTINKINKVIENLLKNEFEK